MRDVLPPNNQDSRSIRNIPVPPGRRHFSRSDNSGQTGDESARRGHGKFFWTFGGGFLVFCSIAGFLMTTVFAGAIVTVSPRQATVSLPTSLVSLPDAPLGQLSYETVTVSGKAERTLASQGETSSVASAQGTIVIYNAYNTSAQKLIANTRFETPDGKIYRIHEAVVVPGGTRKADGTLSPGSVSTVVYADQGGETYNIGATRFTIPGFKNDPRFNAFYAETQGITGGMSGTRPLVNEAELESAKASMEKELAESLVASVPSAIPEGYAQIQNTFIPIYGSITIHSAGEGQALVSLPASGTVAAVRLADLANMVAKGQVEGYGGEAVTFLHPEEIAITASTEISAPAISERLTLTFSGASPLVWQFDPEALKQALAGKTKAEFDSIASSFAPAIAEATASIRPFWKTAFPENTKKIEVRTVRN